MSVRPVKAISIIGLTSELDKVIRYCGESEIFHPDDAMTFYENTGSFVPINERNPYQEPLAELISSAQAANIKLEFKKIKRFTVSESGVRKYIKFLSSKLDRFTTEKLKVQAELDECLRNQEELNHFIGSNLDLEKLFACRYINVNFGRIPKESYDRLKELNSNPYVLFFPCSSDQTHYWGVYFSPLGSEDQIDRIFASLYFERLKLPKNISNPDKYIDRLKTKEITLRQRLTKIEQQISFFWAAEKDKCMMYYSRLKEMNTYYTIKRYVYQYHKNFILVGWIPAEYEDEFTRGLDKIPSIEYSLSDGKDEIKHSPPVILKNPTFAKRYEYYVKMFGLPNYNEIDPTMLVAITYTLFFGIMFGDFGQGILLSIVGGLMWKLKKMDIGKILIPCGISSAIFGFIYGSCFGFEEAFNPIYKAIFGLDEKPVDVMSPTTSNMIVYASVGVGAVIIMIVMLMNIFSSLKRKDYESGIFGPNGIAGFVFYTSLVVGLVCQMVLGIAIMNIIYVIALIIIPLILIFLREPFGKLVSGDKNWQPAKWGEYCVQNFFELFETCLSYVTNTMSFLRIGAYVLVHAGMMLVVFTLANMAGGGVMYVLIIAIGNAIVMALEALLVAIQVLRLEYYELFSRFYVGQGRAFEPIKLEENQQ